MRNSLFCNIAFAGKALSYRVIALFFFLFFLPILPHSFGQEHSVAREWNELVLESIRNDFARPTIHARNLFHTSIAMYDAWALFDETANTYLLGRERGTFKSAFALEDIDGLRASKDLDKTISYAIYRIILHRYANSPGFFETRELINLKMLELGYDVNFSSIDYNDKDPASLGNYIALEVIKFGLQDGSNEQNEYENNFYEPINQALDPTRPGAANILDPNRWQPLFFNTFVDQSGNPLPQSVPSFLSPEWGLTATFALEDSDKKNYDRAGDIYPVYLDPGEPPLIDGNETEEYCWGFSLVAEWSSHLDPEDETDIDISPASIGNIDAFPSTFEEYKSFYKSGGGDWGVGHTVNPKTMEPYASQVVSRGDYTRVLAEFWADGPDSETPPGHWYSILNYVMDHPEFTRKYAGENELESLEYDVKAYFMLGGAVHDSAIAAWSVKGYYDYVRPISALRYMASKGQSTDPDLPNYHSEGIQLIDNVIALIEQGDVDFPDPDLVGKVKVRTWKGPTYIDNPAIDVAGVDWILAEDWWPYQRPSFVTPPFAGYVSGHSTFSRAAAEVLTYLTGDEYFPGGMGVFLAEENSFLVFEEGPSQDIELQWATYRDASDQCSLSRIWGGIHPPADDIPGRKMGEIVGAKAIRLSNNYFKGEIEYEDIVRSEEEIILFPNPVQQGDLIQVEINGVFEELFIINSLSQIVYSQTIDYPYLQLSTKNFSPGIYFIVLNLNGHKVSQKLVVY